MLGSKRKPLPLDPFVLVFARMAGTTGKHPLPRRRWQSQIRSHPQQYRYRYTTHSDTATGDTSAGRWQRPYPRGTPPLPRTTPIYPSTVTQILIADIETP